MSNGAQDSALGDIEYLSRSEHRVAILDALCDAPRNRDELRELSDASSSTVGRVLEALEQRQWVKHTGGRYEATQLGSHVNDGFQALLNGMAVERQLRSLWPSLPRQLREDLPIDIIDTGHVTVAGPDAPYRPINQFVELAKQSSSLRFVGFDLGLVEPCFSEMRRQILDGLDARVIDPPEVVSYLISEYPDDCEAIFSSGNLNLSVSDELPEYGIGIFDESVIICVYDPEAGTIRGLIESDHEAVRSWAMEQFDHYLETARPFEKLELSSQLDL